MNLPIDQVSILAAVSAGGGSGEGVFSFETLTWLLIYLFVALVFSFLCSVAEAVLLSVNRAYIDTLKEHGAKAAEILSRFKARPDEPLSAILTLNTVAHTVGAAGVGYEAAALFGQKWLGLASVIMTLLILIGSEIIPKTIGATHWRRLAVMTAYGVSLLTWLLKPFIRVLQYFTRGLSGHDIGHDQSRAEIESVIWRASQSGTLSDAEAAVLKNLFELRRVPVKKIMTPRVVVFSLPETMTVGEYRAAHAANVFSRIPIYGENLDEVTGFVLRSELLAVDRAEATLLDFRRDLPVVTESLPVSSLYTEILDGRDHIALVANEYGVYTGIATLEDVIETLLGREIVDELDSVTDMRWVARQKARANGMKLPEAVIKAAAERDSPRDART